MVELNMCVVIVRMNGANMSKSLRLSEKDLQSVNIKTAQSEQKLEQYMQQVLQSGRGNIEYLAKVFAQMIVHAAHYGDSYVQNLPTGNIYNPGGQKQQAPVQQVQPVQQQNTNAVPYTGGGNPSAVRGGNPINSR